MSEPARVIAAFDIGSNSVKMTVGSMEADGHLVELVSRAATVRLGAGLDVTGLLAADRIEAALTALDAFTAEARSLGADRLIGVATEATRVAANGPAFLDQLSDQFGLEVQSISGDREADLTFLGLDASIDRGGSALVADIGGGSTELIAAVDGVVSGARSFPVGSGRLTDRYVTHDPPTPAEVSAMRQAATDILSEFTYAPPTARLIAVGGSAEYLGRLLATGWPARMADLETALELMERTPAAELALVIDAPIERARVLPAGAAILAALAPLCQPTEILGAASGIRLGLLHAAFMGTL